MIKKTPFKLLIIEEKLIPFPKAENRFRRIWLMISVPV